MKCMRKAHIESLNAVENVLSERAILAETDCPFVVKLHATFKTQKFIFMVMDANMGGELLTMINNERQLSQKKVKFYTACIVLAIQHLHHNKIMYRDLKPENCMIDNQGYIQLVDFGFAKKCSNKTYTMCGTPDFMAPEIIRKQGHGVNVDWWALGCLVYELLVGYSPFSDPSNNALQIYENIVKGEFEFPAGFPSAASNLVTKFLDKNPKKRFGWATGSVKDIKVMQLY